MSDSKRWALEKLERANAIFEPDQKHWRVQLLDLVIWSAEVAAVWWLAVRLWP